MKNDKMDVIAPTAGQLLLNRYLSDIFDLGDCDEMSWKHIGHGCAALLAFKDWREAVDYGLPDVDLTPPQLQKLDALWFQVADILKKKGAEWFRSTLSVLANYNWKLMYADTYLDDEWMGYKIEGDK